MNTNRRKAFRTIADVLRSPIVELAALRRKPVQKTDRVMRSSKLEDSIYAELREDDAEMDLTENAAAQKLKCPTVPGNISAPKIRKNWKKRC